MKGRPSPHPASKKSKGKIKKDEDTLLCDNTMALWTKEFIVSYYSIIAIGIEFFFFPLKSHHAFYTFPSFLSLLPSFLLAACLAACLLAHSPFQLPTRPPTCH